MIVVLGLVIVIVFFIVTVALALSALQVWITRDSVGAAKAEDSHTEPAAFDSQFLREVGIRSD